MGDEEELHQAIGVEPGQGVSPLVLKKMQEHAEILSAKKDGRPSTPGALKMRGVDPEAVQKSLKLAMEVGKDLMALKSGVEFEKLEVAISSSTSPDKSVLPTMMIWLKEKLGDEVFP